MGEYMGTSRNMVGVDLSRGTTTRNASASQSETYILGSNFGAYSGDCVQVVPGSADFAVLQSQLPSAFADGGKTGGKYSQCATMGWGKTAWSVHLPNPAGVGNGAWFGHP